jgi:hypothetical protein
MQIFLAERPKDRTHIFVDMAARRTFHKCREELEENPKAIWDIAFEEGAAYQRAQQRDVMKALADECNRLTEELKLLKWSTAADLVHMSPQLQGLPVGEFWARHRQIMAGLHDMANGWTTESVDSRLICSAIAHMEVLALRGLDHELAQADGKANECHFTTTNLSSPGPNGAH